MSAEGATLIPNIPFVILNPMTNKQFNELTLEISMAMMLTPDDRGYLISVLRTSHQLDLDPRSYPRLLNLGPCGPHTRAVRFHLPRFALSPLRFAL
jgi:hypothetical protein